MKERPVIFNGEMVRAILDGRKTQTRRAISDRQLHLIDVASQVGECYPLESGIDHANSQSYYREHCPFGQVGDRLWVRETFAGHYLDDDQIQDIKDGRYKAEDLCEYRANYSDDADCVDGWTPSIHMSRWASRITLEITAVRVERLNDISEEDAKAEGVKPAGDMLPDYPDTFLTPKGDFATAKVAFQRLWQSIYGEESWSANPWVWVIEFRRLEVRDASK
ncbi:MULTISPECIES: hypothetical protein [Serratia]|uniref:hypothetical protein n=1 Tax=Serratia TaxID=613 RepID=UPI00276B1A62|nr:hypothetical protein [Serratia marcescens]MDP8624890.1 hypothetical protein [Serratia marcescens]MDP8674321.1 hypothetical protein [Serratia marcescens]MDP8689323.1 hypothetical protein [Serratia marcescens]MDP8699070.1 hypothetical protein [Serratia marcescens]MDP8708748.1 hypothetical protein [Serratia marcescens]